MRIRRIGTRLCEGDARCANCYFWRQRGDSDFGDCLINPPTISDNITVWPTPHLDDTCGKHKEIPNPDNATPKDIGEGSTPYEMS